MRAAQYEANDAAGDIPRVGDIMSGGRDVA
jgi:hypothetical protein